MSHDGLGPKQIARIEELVHEIEALPDVTSRATAAELVQLLMEFYGQGLARMLAIAGQNGAAGAGVVDAFTRDAMVSQLLMLHNLHPVDLPTRIGQALDKVRPLLHSHGGDVELLGIENGLVRLRLRGKLSRLSVVDAHAQAFDRRGDLRVRPRYQRARRSRPGRAAARRRVLFHWKPFSCGKRRGFSPNISSRVKRPQSNESRAPDAGDGLGNLIAEPLAGRAAKLVAAASARRALRDVQPAAGGRASTPG
jgi:hypothetical protein